MMRRLDSNRVAPWLLAAAVILAGASPAPSVREYAVDPGWWREHVALVHVKIAGKVHTAILDTGGFTELRAASPRDFETYYRGLPIDAAVGADTLARYVVTLGKPADTTPITLAVAVRHLRHETFAFVPVTIDRKRFTMLFDTGAVGWLRSDVAYQRPFGISFLRSSVFQDLHRHHPQWAFHASAVRVANEKGAIVRASSITVPSLAVGSIIAGPVTFIERADDTTYAAIWRLAKIDVNGDLGLNALDPKWITLDFTHASIGLGR